MPVYEYKTRDIKDKIVSGRMEADTELDLVKKLKGMNYIVTGISEVKRRHIDLGIGEIRIKRKEILKFVLKLANMLQVGISLPNSIRIMKEQVVKPRFRKVLDSLYTNITSGSAFSSALSHYPGVFPNIMIRMVEVGEATGNLAEVLAQYAEYAENQEDIKDKIKSSLMYPVAVLSMVLIIAFIFLTFVIPRFMSVFQSTNTVLPLPTQILINLSNFTRNYWLHTVVVIIALAVGYKISRRIGVFNDIIDNIKLKIPGISELLKKIIQASFTETLGILYQAGIPILESLRICENVVGNTQYSRAIVKLQGHVKDGKKISDYIGTSRLFNPEIAEMVNVGESTGRLAEMLRKTASFYYKDVDIAVKNLVSLFEPFLICCLGVFICFLALAIIMPIFSMMKAIGGT